MIHKKVKKFNICIISHFGYPLFNKRCRESFGGGAAVQLYLLSKELAKCENFNVNVITGNYKTNKYTIEIIGNIQLFKVLPLKRKKINYFKGIIIFFLTLKKIKSDIIIQRGAGVTAGFSVLYCKLFNKKFIYSIAHEIDVNGEAEKGFEGKIFRYGLNNANYIVAQNEEQIKILENYKKRKFNNIKIIKSGYRIENVEIKKKFYILWVARADKWKRPELFLKLALKFPSDKFIMICNKGQDIDFWNNIRRNAFKISNLDFFDFISFQEIDQYFKDAKIFVNTSIYEGFPNTFIQAAMHKTPIVSLNVNPDNILDKYKIGFFCENNFYKVEEKLKKLLQNPNIYETYSKNAYLYAKKFHDIKKIKNKWIQLIEKIADQ